MLPSFFSQTRKSLNSLVFEKTSTYITFYGSFTFVDLFDPLEPLDEAVNGRPSGFITPLMSLAKMFF